MIFRFDMIYVVSRLASGGCDTLRRDRQCCCADSAPWRAPPSVPEADIPGQSRRSVSRIKPTWRPAPTTRASRGSRGTWTVGVALPVVNTEGSGKNRSYQNSRRGVTRNNTKGMAAYPPNLSPMQQTHVSPFWTRPPVLPTVA